MRPQSVLASRLSSVRLRTRSALLRSELARRPARVLLLVLRSALLRSEEEWPQVDLSIASADCNEPALNQCTVGFLHPDSDERHSLIEEYDCT